MKPILPLLITASLAKGELSIRDEAPFNKANAHYVRLQSEGKAPFGISNEGFRRMGVRKGEAYDFSAQEWGMGVSVQILTENPASLAFRHAPETSVLNFPVPFRLFARSHCRNIHRLMPPRDRPEFAL